MLDLETIEPELARQVFHTSEKCEYLNAKLSEVKLT